MHVHISCKAINHNKTNTYKPIIHCKNQNMTNTPEFIHGDLYLLANYLG